MENTSKDLESLWQKYLKLAGMVSEKRPEIDGLLEELGERIIISSASIEEKYPGCGPGGLVETSLLVTMKMRDMSKMMPLDVSSEISTESLILVGLFHNLGQIGDRTRPYLIDQESDWHRKRGILYTYNEDLPKTMIQHRSLQLLQDFGVKLTFDEWIAIAISGGPHREENRFYVGNEPPLALLLTQARQWIFNRR